MNKDCRYQSLLLGVCTMLGRLWTFLYIQPKISKRGHIFSKRFQKIRNCSIFENLKIQRNRNSRLELSINFGIPHMGLPANVVRFVTGNSMKIQTGIFHGIVSALCLYSVLFPRQFELKCGIFQKRNFRVTCLCVRPFTCFKFSDV